MGQGTTTNEKKKLKKYLEMLQGDIENLNSRLQRAETNFEGHFNVLNKRIEALPVVTVPDAVLVGVRVQLEALDKGRQDFAKVCAASQDLLYRVNRLEKLRGGGA